MKNIIEIYPEVSNVFFELTDRVTYESDLSSKNKELVLIGMFTINNGLSGLKTHTKRAIKNGANKNDILSTIMLAIPVIGITNVTVAFNEALSIIDSKE